MVQLRLFGGASIETSSGPVSGAAAQRRRLALLALLAASPRSSMSRDKVAAFLFPELDAGRASHAISDAVHALRRAFGRETIHSVGNELRLDPAGITSDVALFEELLAAGHNEAASRLYAGPFLDGFFVPEAPEFERWVDGQRDAYARRYSRALEQLAAQHEAAGDFVSASEAWHLLAAHDPLSSRVALRLMHALDAAGEWAAALRHADLHAAFVRSELGAGPDPDVSAFAEKLRVTRDPADRTVAPIQRRPHAMALPIPEPVPEPDGTPTSGVESSRFEEREEARIQPIQPRSRPIGWRIVVLAGVTAVAGVALWTSSSRGWPLRPGPNADQRTIDAVAVMPFENLSGNPDQQHLADGMTDAIITELGRYRRLRVISRTSVLRYRGATTPIAEIARDLDVDAVVEGGVVADSNRIAIRVRLVRGSDEQQLSSATYERGRDDLLALQRDVAQAIVREVRVAVGDTAQMGQRTSDAQAYELYLRGRVAKTARTLESLQRAAFYLRAAIQRDSGFADAFAALADVERLLGVYNYSDVTAATERAHALTDRALLLDPKLASAHALRAQDLADDLRWEDARAAFNYAIELDPSDALTHHRYALTMGMMRRWDDAIAEAAIARSLDPFYAPTTTVIAQAMQQKGRNAEAREECRRAIELDPTDPWPRFSCGMLFADLGNLPEAFAELNEVNRITAGNPIATAGLATLHALSGDSGQARQLLDSLLLKRTPAARPFHVALVFAALGNHDAAFEWLDREPWIGQTKYMLHVHGALDPLRADPRYHRLLQRLRLVR